MAGTGKYKDSINLPRTEFPMRGNLTVREPELLARWKEIDLYGQIQKLRADRPKYLLHDGPPYSNGHIHHGHVLNKILKDLVVKYKTMAGFRSPYVPGWDTHGLPIEWAVDRELGERKRSMSKVEIRRACRDYAMKWVEIQKNEFSRLAVFGTWDQPYLTLDPGYDAAIVRALAAFARGGYLYRGKKPVYWCPNDRTALAKAEVEYADEESPSIYVRFPLDGFDGGRLAPALSGKKLALAVWTTTPWTLPANLAVVMHPRFEYAAVPSPRDAGEYLIVAKELAEPFLRAIGGSAEPTTWVDIAADRVPLLEGARYVHPLVDAPRSDRDFRVWFADYVTLEATGLVHTAPGHGAEDYQTGVAHGLDVYAPIDEAGKFTAEVPRWQGDLAWHANPKIEAHLDQVGALLNKPGQKIKHSYPHCWRCKGPILFRATPQWFVRIDHNSLRERALGEIELTEWIPPWGRDRIHGMIANRPDWCLSRQRVWGVPIPAFYCDSCGHVEANAEAMEHVAAVFEREGSDAWYARPASELAPRGMKCSACGGTSFSLENDIVDVWFESGCSWFAVCAPRADLGDIDLYLEGSDQHRGWFHSSLLVGIGVSGEAPYKTVLTHGWVLDEDGRPYSKSQIEEARRQGKKIKYVSPEELIEKNGSELFRLWAASTDFRGDIPFSEAVLRGLQDWYRKFRNTSRFILGNLYDFDPDAAPLERAELADIDRYALARLGDLVARVREAYDAFEFHVVYRSLVDYVANDLSALYLDVIKDRLYNDAPGSASRRAAQVVLYTIGSSLARMTAPFLAFTAEDIWDHLPRRKGHLPSVHLAELPGGRRLADTDELAVLWELLLRYRDAATKKLEAFRAEKHRSEDAQVTIRPVRSDRERLVGREEQIAQLFLVSKVVIGDASAGDQPEIDVAQAPGARCERCWKWYEAMAPGSDDLCVRCQGAVNALGLAQ